MTKPELRKLNSKRKHYGTKDLPKEEKKKPQVVGFFQLFRLSNACDKFLMVIGILSSILSGFGYPLAVIAFGNCVEKMVSGERIFRLIDRNMDFLVLANLSKNDAIDDPTVLKPLCNRTGYPHNTSDICHGLELDIPWIDQIIPYVFFMAMIAVGSFVTVTIYTMMWALASERQAHRIRHKIFQNILRQDIGWFDLHDVRELVSRMISDIDILKMGMGVAVGLVIQNVSSFVISHVIAFVIQPKLAGVMVGVGPLFALGISAFSYVATAMTIKERTAYAKAGSVAQEVLGSIRTVVAFGGENKEVTRYEKNLTDAKRYARIKGIGQGVSIGFLTMIRMFTYALGMWYGGMLVTNEGKKVQEVILVFYSVVIGVVCIGGVTPGIKNISEAKGAAYNIFSLIDQKPKIDSGSKNGVKPASAGGHVRFRDVHFCYPARPDREILKGINLEVQVGQTIALVGASGCGKTTLFQLLLRFYDPHNGQITLDGDDIKDINIKWLRQTIGIVSQEPFLFDTSIAQNIRYGQEDVSMEDIEEAARKANAYDFITELPEKFDTVVGERGALLSGGQKQRIAIARALVRNPKILLLDEATSALDTESESIVQDALDKARSGRTTLIIAHRLSTICNADVIVGIEGGVVMEKGTHDQLMDIDGIYHKLVINQTKNDEINIDIPQTKDSPREYYKPLRKDGPTDITLFDGRPTDDTEEMDEDLPDASFFRLIMLSSSEWYLVALGCLGAIVFGLVQPAFAIMVGTLFSVYGKERDSQESQFDKLSLIIVGLGILSQAGSILQGWMLSLAGEALTQRLRTRLFRAMLKQEMSWFDKPSNNKAALTTRLALDTPRLQEVSAASLAMNLQALVAAGGAIILCFVYCGWKLTLVSAICFPTSMFAGVLHIRMGAGRSNTNSVALENTSKIVIETVENMKTVASLTREDTFLNMYLSRLREMLVSTQRSVLLNALYFGVGYSSFFLFQALLFGYGAYLVKEQEMTSDGVLKTVAIFILCGIFVGQSATHGTSIRAAKVSASKVFSILDRTPEIDVDFSHEMEPLDISSFQSAVTFQNVHFRYPCRAHVQILQGLRFSVEPGQTVALVGSSGCGKTTVISLLQRFYDLQNGNVTIDQHDIRDISVRWLRSQIGLVSQEPVLFDCTIAQNIAYGDNSRVVPINEIIEVAKMANIHKFIDALPKGYETEVGDRGTQLSVGQKQRIAIARALVRNPRILLLDEATSALDTESEKIVQEALTKAREGRTCIIIAHRLSTIQDADKIILIHQGRVLEQGTHQELIALRGFYNRLYTAHNTQT